MTKIRAFTLVELIVATAVFSLVVLLAAMILRGGEDQSRVGDVKMNLEEQLREGLSRITREIRGASPSRVAITENGTVLTFQIPSQVSNSGAITWSNPITYRRAGTQLVRFDAGTNQTTVLANDIQGVAFTATGNPAASIGLSLTGQRAMINGRNLSVTSTGEARLRNP